MGHIVPGMSEEIIYSIQMLNQSAHDRNKTAIKETINAALANTVADKWII